MNIPKKYIVNLGDRVNYKATGPETIYKSDLWQCYKPHMDSLHSRTFTCFPVQAKSILSIKQFERWMNYGKDNNIVPKNLTVEVKGGKNICRIPEGNNRHQVFAGLCFYRWADNNPRFVYHILQLMRYKKFNFFQVLHYACCKYGIYSNHSFLDVYLRCPSKKFPKMCYLPSGMATAQFFRSEMQEKGSTSKAIDGILAKNGFQRLTAEISPAMYSDVYRKPYVDELPDLFVKEPEGILDKSLMQFYEENLDVEKLRNHVQKISSVNYSGS